MVWTGQEILCREGNRRTAYSLRLEAHSIHTPSDAFCELSDKFGVMDFWGRYAGTLSSGKINQLPISLNDHVISIFSAKNILHL